MINKKRLTSLLKNIQNDLKEIKKISLDDQEIKICNKCGDPVGKCCFGYDNENDINYGLNQYGLIDAEVGGGYCSKFLLDLNIYKFNLCEKCLRYLFMEFKIPPKCNDNGEDYDFKSDQKYFEYRMWQEEGGHHQAYINGKCNQIKNCPNNAIYTHLISGEFSEDCACEEHKDLRIYGNVQLTKFIKNKLKILL